MAIFKLSTGFQINQETGVVEGNSKASASFRRRVPGWMNMSEKELSEQLMVVGYGSFEIVSEDSEEPEPEKKSKKKGVFSKTKDDDEKVVD